MSAGFYVRSGGIQAFFNLFHQVLNFIQILQPGFIVFTVLSGIPGFHFGVEIRDLGEEASKLLRPQGGKIRQICEVKHGLLHSFVQVFAGNGSDLSQKNADFILQQEAPLFNDWENFPYMGTFRGAVVV